MISGFNRVQKLNKKLHPVLHPLFTQRKQLHRHKADQRSHQLSLKYTERQRQRSMVTLGNRCGTDFQASP